MKIWIDDLRPAPEGYVWCKSVNDAKTLIGFIWFYEPRTGKTIELIDIDHDAGEYADQGGDYIKLLDWLEETGLNYPIRIHSMNVVGVQNMLAICKRNGWTVIP